MPLLRCCRQPWHLHSWSLPRLAWRVSSLSNFRRYTTTQTRGAATASGGDATPRSAATSPAATPLPAPHFASPSPPPARATSSDESTAFTYLFNEVFTTLDVAPVKRPQLMGSLQCTVDDYPVTIVFVDECTGLTSEEVTQKVQQRAVYTARALRACTSLPVRPFLLQQVCGQWPAVMRLLRSLDLVLQLRLIASEANLDSHTHVKSAAAVTRSPSSSAPPPVQWSGSASLYDPWQENPSFTALAFCEASVVAPTTEKATLSLTGDLESVLRRVLTTVEQSLLARSAAFVQESAEEAARYVHEAGSVESERWLTAPLEKAAAATATWTNAHAAWCSRRARCVCAVAQRGKWDGEDADRTRAAMAAATPASTPWWLLTCATWVDVSRKTAIAVQVKLTTGIGGAGAAALPITSAHTHSSSVVLTEAHVNYPLVPISDADDDTEGESCVFVHDECTPEMEDNRQPPLQEGPLTASQLSTQLDNGTVVLTSDWLHTPLRACGHFVEQAALLSPTVAYDWLGNGRTEAEATACFATTSSSSDCALRRGTAVDDAVALSSIVQWTSFEGRTVLDAFAQAAAACVESAPTGAVCDGGSAPAHPTTLPPLWPRVSLTESHAPAARRAGLREVLHVEVGLRHLRRHDCVARAKLGHAAPIAFTCEAEVVHAGAMPTSESLQKPAEPRVRVGAVWYADAVAAAQVHTPWATPLCSRDSPSATVLPRDSTVTASRERRRRVKPQAVRKSQVSVLSVEGSLARSGVTHATWDATAKMLLCTTSDLRVPPMRFSNLHTVDGLVTLLKFCSRHAVYNEVYLSKSPDKMVEPLLKKMMVSGQAKTETSKKLWNSSHSGGSSDNLRSATSASNWSSVPTSVSADPDPACVIAVLPLPFEAGQVQLVASSQVARTTEVRRLLTCVQHYSKAPHFLTPLLAAVAPAHATLFHVWDVTAPWVHPRGPLRVSFTAEAANTSPSADGTRPAEIAVAQSCGTPQPPRGFTLCLEAARNDASVSQDGKDTTASPPLLSWRVPLPADGPTFALEAYTAFRTAALTTRVAPSPPLQVAHAAQDASAAPQAARLLGSCATVAQLAQVALCTALNTPASRRNLSLSRLVFLLFGNAPLYIREGDRRELRVQVMPDVSVCLASFSGELAELDGDAHALGWRDALCREFFKSVAPDTLAALSEARRLHEYLTRSATPQQLAFGAAVDVRVSWEAAPVCASAAVAEVHAAPLRFTVSGLRSAAMPLALTLPPASQESEKTVLFSCSGESLAALLGEVCETALPAAFTTFCAAEIKETERTAARQSFLIASQEKLATYYNVEKVVTEYDLSKKLIRIRSCSADTPTEKTTPAKSTFVLLAQETVELGCVPQTVFRLYRQLLYGIGEKKEKKAMDTLSTWTTADLLLYLHITLNCSVDELQVETVWSDALWCSTLTLPWRLFHLNICSERAAAELGDAASASPPDVFYVSCTHREKKKAARQLLICLCHWTCFSYAAEVDYAKVYGVHCSINHPSARQYDEKAQSHAAPSHPQCLTAGARVSGGTSDCHEERFKKPTSSVSSPQRFSPVPQDRPGQQQQQQQRHLRHAQEIHASQRGFTLPSPSAASTLVDARRPAAKASLLSCAHRHVKALLTALVDDTDGHVVLKLSQTFGVELMYVVTSGNSDSGCVQLLREAWANSLWGPAQVLRGEAAVIKRLVCRDPQRLTPAESAARLRDALTAALKGQPLRTLRCGTDVSRREFCVGFLQRYFGWRVCEQADLADMPVEATGSDIVVYEHVTSTPPRRRRGNVDTSPTTVRAALCLGQLAAAGESTVRLAQVLAEVTDTDAEKARGRLWDACARHIRDVFGVSRLMTVAEVDAGMLNFMVNALK